MNDDRFSQDKLHRLQHSRWAHFGNSDVPGCFGFGFSSCPDFSAEDFGVEVNAVSVKTAGAREQRHGHAEHPEQRECNHLAHYELHATRGAGILRNQCYYLGGILVQPCASRTSQEL